MKIRIGGGKLRSVGCLKTFHGNSNRATRGLQHFASEEGVAERKMIHHSQGHSFGFYQEWKGKTVQLLPIYIYNSSTPFLARSSSCKGSG